jgi:apolipoprotein N-acyltransferase
MITLILLAFAFVFFVLAGLGVPNPPRINFLGWSLALWVLTEILKGTFPHA